MARPPAAARAGGAPSEAERLYLRFIEQVRAAGLPVEAGSFGAHMDVELVNDGPVTFTMSCAPGGSVGN